jgi:single-strand DNA-binding protein
MASLNKVLLIGNLTRDPELKYTPGGSAVADFGLAVNRNWTGQDGQKHEETTFVDITVWGRQAEIASEYLSKGRPIFLEGRLQLDQWQDKEGQKRSKMRVVAERIQFLGAPPGKGAPDAASRDAAPRKAPAPPDEFNNEPPAAPADEIPF